MNAYDEARTRGLAAFAAWDDDGNPKLCPECGSWTRADGTSGPLLPTCADWRKDFSNPWPHNLSCARVRESDYADDVCAACKSGRRDHRDDEGRSGAQDGSGDV